MFLMDEDDLSFSRTLCLPPVDISNISESFARHQQVCDRIRRRYNRKKIPILSAFSPWIIIIGFEIPGNG